MPAVTNRVPPSPRLLTVFSILLTLLVPPLLVLTSVRLVMTEGYLSIIYNRPDFPTDEYGFTREDRRHYAPYALQYLLGPAGIEYLGNLTFPGGQALFNERELTHMVDVKRVFQTALLVFGILLLMFAILLGITVRTVEGRQMLRQGLFGGGLLTLAILAGLVIFLLVNWETFFTNFHNLFFASGTWVFDYSDTLIRLFPIPFWQDTALTIGGLSALGAIAILIGCWQWNRQAHAEHSAPFSQSSTSR